MENSLRKGRALQLEGLHNASVKVTIGFKCEGHEKIRLAKEANRLGMTLSEYVEAILLSRYAILGAANVTDINAELEKSQQVAQQLQQQLNFYERNEKIQRLLTTHKGGNLGIHR